MRIQPPAIMGSLVNFVLLFALVAETSHQTAAFSSAATPAPGSAPTSVTGWLEKVWRDGPLGSKQEYPPTFGVVDELGHWNPTLIPADVARPFGGLDALVGKRVTVSGHWSASPNNATLSPDHEPLLWVESIQTEQAQGRTGASAKAVIGSYPWITLLCRVSDSKVFTTDTLTHYGKLIGNQYPGLDHFWRELSDSQMNLSGSQVKGWYNLPNPNSYYWRLSGGQYWFYLDRVANDCTAAADNDVFFPYFAGVNIILPAPESYNGMTPSQGGGWTLNRDGQTKGYMFTWIPNEIGCHTLPPPGISECYSQWLVSHEMGHGFGLPHSSGPYDTAYDSMWDVMSGTRFAVPYMPAIDPEFGIIAQHTVSFHKNLLDWIPSGRKFVATLGISQTVTLERLEGPLTAGNNYLMAQIPIGGSATQYYTVEARRFAGYDSHLPGEAIILHRVDTTRSDRQAQVVDVDNNGDPNDEGARWTPSETFVDSTNRITISVTAATTTGYVVSLQNSPPPCCEKAFVPFVTK